MDVKTQGPFNVSGEEFKAACVKLMEVSTLFVSTDYPIARGLAATVTAALNFVMYEWPDKGVRALTTPHRTAELNRHYKAMVDAAEEAVSFMAAIENGTYQDPTPDA